MTEILKKFADFINDFHDLVVDKLGSKAGGFTDKELHFIFMAILGIGIFAVTQFVFKKLAKYSITAISFIYTFTVMIVVVFAIEIQQKITNRGNMEFDDILYGIYGFLYAFAIYAFIRILIYIYKKYISPKFKKKKR